MILCAEGKDQGCLVKQVLESWETYAMGSRSCFDLTWRNIGM